MSQNAKSKRETVGFWLRWLKSAQANKKYKRHQRESKAAWDEYEMEVRDDRDDKIPRGYPIYFASSQILGPSLYSRTPKAAPKRLHGIDDQLALTMELIAKRLGQFNLDNSDFDEGMFGARDDLMHTAKCLTQVTYDTELEDQRVDLKLDVNGDPEDYEGDFEEDDKGAYYNKPMAIEDTQQIKLSFVPFDEYLHTPNAKSPSDVKEIAYRFCLSREEAEEIYNRDENGKSLKRKLPYRKNSKDDDDFEAAGYEASEPMLYGWEIHCAKTRKIYHVCEDYPTELLKIENDKWEIAGFFPSPKIRIINRPRKFLYPTPIFKYLEATLNQLHVLYYRVHGLIDSVRRRALVYGASPELIDALNNLEGQQFIAMADIATILDKGGINNLIQFIPVKELVDALAEGMNVEDHLKNLVYEWFGVPDIMRGASDPNETAKAQELKNENANDRFKLMRKQLIDLARDSAEIMLDLSLKVYSTEKIKRICGWEFLERGKPGKPAMPAQPPTPENPQGVPATPEEPPRPSHYELFDTALEKLRNDSERLVRIDFETDSTNFRDEQWDIAQSKMLSDTVLQGLATIGGIQHPEYIPITLSLLLAVIETMGGSTQIENMVRSAVADIKKIKENPPKPPPDYEGMKVEIAAQKVKYDAMKAQSDSQAKQAETQVKMTEAAAKQQQAQIDAVISKVELELKGREVATSEQKIMGDQALAQAKEAFNQKLEVVLANQEQQKIEIDQQRLELEKALGVINAQEQLLQEARLEKESILQLAEQRSNEKIAMLEATVAAQANRPKEEKKQAPSAIHVHLGSEKETSYEYDDSGRVTKSRSKSK